MNVGVHGDEDGVEVKKAISLEDRFNVWLLPEVDGASFMITFDFDAKQPVEFT